MTRGPRIRKRKLKSAVLVPPWRKRKANLPWPGLLKIDMPRWKRTRALRLPSAG